MIALLLLIALTSIPLLYLLIIYNGPLAVSRHLPLPERVLTSGLAGGSLMQTVVRERCRRLGLRPSSIQLAWFRNNYHAFTVEAAVELVALGGTRSDFIDRIGESEVVLTHDGYLQLLRGTPREWVDQYLVNQVGVKYRGPYSGGG